MRCLIRVVSVLMVLSTTPTTSSFVMFVKKELIWLINSKLRSTNTKIITQINHPCQFPWIRLNHLIKIHIGRCFDHIKLFSYLILQPINHFTLHYKECRVKRMLSKMLLLMIHDPSFESGTKYVLAVLDILAAFLDATDYISIIM